MFVLAERRTLRSRPASCIVPFTNLTIFRDDQVKTTSLQTGTCHLDIHMQTNNNFAPKNNQIRDKQARNIRSADVSLTE